jgi:glycosyltransferase 2 family protein
MSSSSRKLLLGLLAVLRGVFLVHQFHGFLHLGDFSGAKFLNAIREANFFYLAISLLLIYACYAIRAVRWQVFQRNLGPSRYLNILRMTFAGFGAIFLLGRAGEPVRPLLIARKEKLPVAGMFGIYVLERLFDTASTAVIAAIALVLFESHAHSGDTASKLESAARTGGSLLFAGVLAAIAFLIYLRLHGAAWLEGCMAGWIATPGWRAAVARILLGFARGVQTIKTWGDLFLAVFLSAVHWFLVVIVYYFVAHSFRGTLSTLSLGDVMLVLAFTLVGSAVQLPAVGGGSQLASVLVFTAIFHVETEAATVAALVIWMITFAACSLVGVPLLIHEGFSLGQLREMSATEEKEEAGVLPPGSTQRTLNRPAHPPHSAPTVPLGDNRE